MIAISEKSDPAVNIRDVVEAKRAVYSPDQLHQFKANSDDRDRKNQQQNPAELGPLPQAKDAEKNSNSWYQGQETAQRGQRLQTNGQERQGHARCFIGLCRSEERRVGKECRSRGA